MRLMVARCSIDYSGRLETHLAEATRLLMFKADGTFMVWSDHGSQSVKPLNWMTPPTAIEEIPGAGTGTPPTRQPGRIIVRKHAGASEDRLEIELHEVLSDVTHEMGSPDADVPLAKDGVEAHLQEALAAAPEWCGEGFRLVRREWPTDIGPVDLMCRDEEDGWVAVEIKRVAGIEAVEQLSRYLERIRLDPAFAECRGVLAAQVIKPQARVLAERARDRVRRGRPGGRAWRTRAGPEIVRGMTDGAADAAVLTERRDRVLLITLNRPDQRNAVNAAVATGIAAALDELDADAGLSIGVITGAGKGFCSGMDLKAFVTGESPVVEGRGFAGITQRAAAKPLIAAVEGFAVAGGLEVALSCDLIVAARGARLGHPGGQALAGRRRRRAAAPAAHAPPQRRDGDGAHRRPHLGRAGAPSWAWSTGWPSRAGRWTRPSSWPRRSPPTARWRWPPPSASSPSRRLARRGVLRPPGGDRRAGARLRGRARGRHGVRREARAGLEGPLA